LKFGAVPPAEFVPVAEQTGGSRQLTDWVRTLKRNLLRCEGIHEAFFDADFIAGDLEVPDRIRDGLAQSTVYTLCEDHEGSLWAGTATGAGAAFTGAALRRAMAIEAVRERYRGMGVQVMDMTQAEFAAYVRADYDKWLKVARDGNIVVE
jgi:hypothetical protein